MPTKLNLATRPFTNRSLPWILSGLIIFVSLVSLVFILRATRNAEAQSVAVQKDINAMGQQEKVLQEQAQAVKGSLTTEQLQTLSAAHVLVDRKHFSWSRLLADMEAALPGDARVKRIAVREITNVGGQTLAELELVVIAKTPNVVTDMIGSMDKTGIFRAELRSQNLQRGRGESGAEYELFVVYRPRSGYTTENAAVAAVGQQTTSATGEYR